MAKKHISPDVLFECSWEVCNKVGGIYTVLSSKYESVKGELGDRYIFIGPDVWKETRKNPDFIEDRGLYRSWIENAEKNGLRLRIGRWNIPGKPIAVLVDFTTFFTEKDKIFGSLWETYKLDSLSGGWDYIEPALFGYAAGKVVEDFYNYYLTPSDRVIAHFHEWMTGSGILYIEKEAPQIATVFTTHATALGRSIAGNDLPLYENMEDIRPAEMAKKLGIISKYSLEYNAAKNADSFTTVSEITARECKNFLGREVDIVTPNGFSESFIKEKDEFTARQKSSREKIIDVASALLNQKISEDAMICLTSGRYEYQNKGIDAFIDALALADKRKDLDKEVLAFITIPGNHSGPRKELLKRLENTDYNNPLKNEHLTHSLYDKINDPVIKRLTEVELSNDLNNKVKVIFVPVYLDGNDGIFNLHYYDFLAGVDLTIFPSFYEPWGYTPHESITFGIPTITTSLAGFGKWVSEKYDVPNKSVAVIERNENNYDQFINQIAESVIHYAGQKPESKEATAIEAHSIAKKLLWNILAEKYFEAYDIAFDEAEESPDRIEHRPAKDITLSDLEIQDEPNWKKFFVRSEIPKELEPLKILSFNLWWCWNQKAEELFESIDPELWTEVGNNPVALLNKLTYERLQELKMNEEFMNQMNLVFEEFNAYMNESENKDEESVAYFSMEFGLHESIKTYSGGLGVLAGDYLKEASDSNKNMFGVGLMYRYGYFTQSISIFGDQIAKSNPQKYTNLPLIPLRNEKDEWIKIELAMPGRNLTAKAWEVKVGRISLYLLDTDIEENSMEDRAITHQLYGGDWNNRFKQELLLGVGGVRLIKSMKLKPTVYHLNEGHAAFAGLERLRHLVEEKGFDFGAALEVIRSTSLFTTHTPVPAGHDTFSEDTLRAYIPHYADRLNLTWNDFMDMGRFDKRNPDEKFSMSVLAANLSQEMNGVSKIHGRVSREMFRKLYQGYYEDEIHIGHVTNGVHLPSWTSRNWKTFYSGKFGNNFIENQTDPDMWKKIHNVSDAQIWKQRKKSKEEFLKFLKQKIKDDLERRQENPRMIYQTLAEIKEDALYIGFARRFATYKRAHLLFTNVEKLTQLVNDQDRPIRFVFAGKAHPNDKPGQDLIKKITEITKQPEFIGKIIFLENYDMSIGRNLTSGVDIWLNTPTRPLEASGTSGEKAIMNGVLNLSVLDGWWAEGYKENAGWAIPEAKTYGNQSFQDELDAEIIYRLLEDEILPTYFDQNNEGVPHKWVSFIKNNIAEIAPHFTMRRMVNDYYERFYSKLFERSKKIRENNYQLAYKIQDWKNHIRNQWENIEIKSVKIPDSTIIPLKLGESFDAEIVIDTNGISSKDIGIDVIIGQKEFDKVKRIIFQKDLNLESSSNGEATYSCKLNITESGVFDFAFRIYPKSEMLAHRQDFPLVKWI